MTTVQTDPPPAARAGPPAAVLPLVVFGAALALFLTTASAHFFSDGVHLTAMVQGGPKPYYNALYVPLGWSVHRVLGAPAGLDAAGSLRLLSALATAGSAALLALALGRRATGALQSFAWLLAFVLAPAVWWFATTVEVHALQLLGLTAATLLALSARDCTRRGAAVRVGCAAVLALSVHLTSVLLLPALFVAARGREPERGLILRPAPLLTGIALAALLAPLLLWIGGGGDMLAKFADLFLGRFREGRLYTPLEMLEFTWSEALLALGALWAALLLALFARTGRDEVRHLATVVLTGLVPFLAVFPQGGVRERGGYFLSLAPALVLLGAEATRRRPRAAGAVAVLAIALAAAYGPLRTRTPERPVATEWALEAARRAGPGSFIYTTTLPRWHALAQEREAGLASDVVRTMQLAPRRLRKDQAVAELAKCLKPEVTGGIYLDRELFGADLDTPARGVLAEFVELVKSTGALLEPVPPGAPLLLRVVPQAR